MYDIVEVEEESGEEHYANKCKSCGYQTSWYAETLKAESFGAELLDYPHPMSDRQKHRIRKLGGRIDKAMSRSQASQYIKSLMRIELLITSCLII